MVAKEELLHQAYTFKKRKYSFGKEGCTMQLHVSMSRVADKDVL